MIKAIFFDFDGVIVESVSIKTNAIAKLFKNENKEIRQRIVNYHLNNTGVSRHEKFRFIYKRMLDRQLSDAELNMLCDRFSTLVLEEVIKAPYVKGVKEFLENSRSKYKCFVISATPQQEIEEIIQKRHMSHFFKATYGAPTKKSDAARDILIRENLKPIEVLYIGDALSDYMAAKVNAVNFVARIDEDGSIFKDIDCLKTKDLTCLKTIIETL